MDGFSLFSLLRNYSAEFIEKSMDDALKECSTSYKALL